MAHSCTDIVSIGSWKVKNCAVSYLIRQSTQQLYTQYHDQQAQRYHHQQPKAKPTKYHGGGPHAGLHAAIAKILRNCTGRDSSCVLPQYRDKDKDTCNEYCCKCYL